MRRLVAVSTLTTAIVLHAPRAAAQQRDAIVLVSAADTISVERFARTASRLESELVFRATAARFTFSAALDARGAVRIFENEYRPTSAERSAPATQSATLSFIGDSVIAEVRGTGSSTAMTQRLATKSGALPYINPSFALVELALGRAIREGRDTVVVPLFAVQGGMTSDAKVIRVGRDSMVLDFGGVAVRLAVNPSGEILGGAVPAQGLRVVRLRNVSDAALSVAKPDYSAPNDAPYTAEDVTIPTKAGFTLAGTLTLPKGANGPVAAVVTITGSGLQDRDEAISLVKGYRLFRQIADTLGRNGIAVLRMDDRGFGRSGGSVATATSADFADDIRAGLAYLRTRREIDPRRLGLVGHSEGGLIAPMVAASDSALRAIVLMAGPSQGGREILEYQARYAVEHDTSLKVPQRDSALTAARASIDSATRASPWLRFFVSYDPLATAGHVKVPTLILQGATDRQVTAEQAEQLAAAIRAAGNARVTVRVFPEANHLFVQDPDGDPSRYSTLPSGAVRSDVLGLLVDWLLGELR